MRLGHPSTKILVNFSRLHNHLVPYSPTQCTISAVGKSKNQPYHTSLAFYTYPLERVHVDLWGPVACASNGHRYYLSIVDAYSRYTWTYFMHNRSGDSQCFVELHRLVEKQLGQTLKGVQSHGVREFHFISTYLPRLGVVHRLTYPYSSKQNGIVERKHRHIVELGLTLLCQASVPLHY